jgi:hypothetical protein
LSDDETWRKMQKIAHQVPRGRGRAISGRAAKADLPELRWTCFGISSGPETFAELAARLHHRRHGDRVRMLDIRIPPVGEGGIFGSAVTASGRRVEDTAAIVSAIEDCILNCHGVLFHAWIEHLVTHDVVARVQELVDEFVNANAGGDDGLEQRFAKKFAVLYAAGVIGLEVGLLPWPENWPMRAVRHCYANSSAIRDPEGVAVKRALKRLARSLDSPTRFSQFAAGRGQYPHWRDGQIGLRLLGGAGATTWIAKHRLDLVVDPGHFATDDQVFDKLVQMKFIRPTDNVTGSRQFRVRADSGEPCKVRLWRLNAKRLREWALTTRERASSGAMRERRATTAMRLESRPHRARTTSLPRR